MLCALSERSIDERESEAQQRAHAAGHGGEGDYSLLDTKSLTDALLDMTVTGGGGGSEARAGCVLWSVEWHTHTHIRIDDIRDLVSPHTTKRCHEHGGCDVARRPRAARKRRRWRSR